MFILLNPITCSNYTTHCLPLYLIYYTAPLPSPWSNLLHNSLPPPLSYLLYKLLPTPIFNRLYNPLSSPLSYLLHNSLPTRLSNRLCNSLPSPISNLLHNSLHIRLANLLHNSLPTPLSNLLHNALVMIIILKYINYMLCSEIYKSRIMNT